MSDMYLIEKRGLYYRPNSSGYVGIKRLAGRFSFKEAAQIVGPNGPDGPQDGMSMWREDDAPDFSPACYHDLKAQEIGYQMGLAENAAEIARLRAKVAKADALADILQSAIIEHDTADYSPNAENPWTMQEWFSDEDRAALATYREGSDT